MQSAEHEPEITELASMLTQGGRGRGKTAVITGPAGFGKTRTLHAFVDSAIARGVTHLGATCLRNEQDHSLGAIHQIFQALGSRTGQTPRALELLQEAVLTAGPSGISPDDLNWIGVTQGLWEVVADRARHGTVLVTIDDIQYADSSSLEILLHFINRLHTADIFMVFTASEGADGVPLRIRTDLMHHPHCRRIKLSPYPLPTIARFARQKLGSGADERTAEEIHRVSGGNAMLVHSLIEDRRHASAGGTPGDEFTGSVRTLLQRIGPTPLRVVHAAAVLGPCASAPLIAEISHLEQATVDRSLEWLSAMGLMGPDGFRHRTARAAVLDSVEPETRRELDGRAARALHTTGMQATVIADHLLDSRTLDDPWVLDVLREAADQALATDQHDLVVRYLRHAVRLCTTEEERTSFVLPLAKALWRINPSTATSHTPSLLRAAYEGRLSSADVHWLLTCMLWQGRTDDAVGLYKLLERGSGGHGGEDTAVWRMSAEHWMAMTHPPVLHSLGGGYRPTPMSETVGGHPGGLYGRAVSTFTTSVREGASEATLRTAEKVLHSVQLEDSHVEPVEAALFCLVYSDRLDKASDLARSLYETAERRSCPTWTSVLAAFRAYIAQCRGELSQAMEYARLSLEVLPARSLGMLAALPLSTLIITHTEMGDYEEAEQYLRYPLPKAVLQTRYGLHLLAARAQYHAAVGQTRTSLSTILRCGTLMRSWEMDNPMLVPWRLGAAGVSAVLKDYDRARKLLDRHQALPHGHTPRTRAFALMVLASTKELRHRPPLLREAVDMLQRPGHDIELLHALTRLSHDLAVLGETDKARLIGQQADTLGRKCNAEPLRRKVADTFENGLEQTGAHRSQSALSPAEHRVASLAALGYTNREISKKSHITVSTVEQHLTRIYRKLGVRGRNDLPLLFSAEELEETGRGTAVAEATRHLSGVPLAG